MKTTSKRENYFKKEDDVKKERQHQKSKNIRYLKFSILDHQEEKDKLLLEN